MSIQAMNPSHRLFSLGKGCDMAAGGTREKAPSVDTVVPPLGYARAEEGDTGAATGLKHGEGGCPDPTENSPNPTSSSQNLEPSSR